MPTASQRTGVLVIRTWFEEESGRTALRGRITRTPDLSASRPTMVAAASEPEILDVVRAWLDAFVGRR